MKKIIFLMIIMSLCAMIWAHPKFMPFKVNPNKFIETRADSLHGFDVISYDISIKIKLPFRKKSSFTPI
jgi:hypothetical protein